MEIPALKDKTVFPDDGVLCTTLGASYPAFEALRATLGDEGITLAWNHYRDGNVWLCKLMAGKKNLGWLIPYTGYFRTNFFFTEKHAGAIAASNLPESAKAEFLHAESTTRLKPISIRIGGMDNLNDAITALRFKQGLSKVK